MSPSFWHSWKIVLLANNTSIKWLCCFGSWNLDVEKIQKSFLFQRQVAKLRRARPNELKLFSAFFTIWEKASVIDSDIYFHYCLNFSSKSGNLPNKGLLEQYFVKPQPFWHNGNVCQSEGPCFLTSRWDWFKKMFYYILSRWIKDEMKK